MQQGQEGHGAMSGKMAGKHYTMLALNLAISLLIMYLAMFVMIWSSDEFFNNTNMLYMALVMWAPMGILMLVFMPMMYPNKKLNLDLLGSFALVLILSVWAIRDQTLVGDRQFVRAMIPHHSGRSPCATGQRFGTGKSAISVSSQTGSSNPRSARSRRWKPSSKDCDED